MMMMLVHMPTDRAWGTWLIHWDCDKTAGDNNEEELEGYGGKDLHGIKRN
jgi:hypothetical protein